jgi:hypothetical protein
MAMLAAVAPVLLASAAGPPWVVLPNVDFPHNAPDGPGVAPGTSYLQAPNASACAAHCVKMTKCAAIAWNGGPGGNGDCNFKCDDIPYPTAHKGQQAIVVRKGGRFCPPRPPPAPPPKPPCPAGETCWHRWATAHPPPDATPSPFKPSSTLSHLEYSDTVSIPAGVGGDTWYVSQINATHLFASWTDGCLTSHGGRDKGVSYRAAGFPTPAEAQSERAGNGSSLSAGPWCTDQPSESGAVKACKQMPSRGYSTGFGIISFSSSSATHSAVATGAAAAGEEGGEGGGVLNPTVVLGNLGTVHADAAPYEGRYPSGVLSYKGTVLKDAVFAIFI